MKRQIKFFSAIIFVAIISSSLLADEGEELCEVVQTKISTVMTLLKDNELQKEQREHKILREIEVLFDYNLIARLSLGKAWKSLNAEKKAKFTEIFTKKLKESYLEKLRLFNNERVVFESSKQTKKNRMEILSYIVGKTDKKEVLYKFHNSKNSGWLIYDLEVEGISILRTYRTQFASELKKGNIDTLLEKLNAE